LRATLAGGFTYLAPASLDHHGDWVGAVEPSNLNKVEMDMRFTIRNDALVSLSCGTTPVILAVPIPISRTDGTFTFRGDDGLTMSGTLDSTTTSHGDVNAPGCGSGGDTQWWAEKSVPTRGARARQP
jgi:hypothetical protein